LAQQRDANSLFSWVRRLIDVRESCPEIGWGESTVIDTDNLAVFAQRFTWENNSVLTVHKLAEEECAPTLDLGKKGIELTELFGNRVYGLNSNANAPIELDGYGYRWFRLESGPAKPGHAR
jgi:maltose alpha-D-glucosyltransferase/alpha-amylase